MNNDDTTLAQSSNERARARAQAAVEGVINQPSGVVSYQSRGRVLVVGGVEAQWLAARIEPPLHAEVLLTGGDDEPGVRCTALGGRAMTLNGHLGAFRAELGEQGHHNHQILDADLVVDLGETPLFDHELPPPGYWHTGREPADLDAVLALLDGMVGTFEKPRFFAYDASICAHARAGQQGCRRCIDSCPAGAIISIGEQIEVDPHLCQGGGICATACPSGALRYAYPSPVDTAERVRGMLRTYTDAGGEHPMVMFCSTDDAASLAPTPAHVLLIAVEELASVGHEIWLAALAWGSRGVVLVDGGSVPQKARDALQQQLTYCRALLDGLNIEPTAVCHVATDRATTQCEPLDNLPAAAAFAATGDKRQLAALALDHLWTHSIDRPGDIELPNGAPYGGIQVDAERCTLCMACTSVCPAKALSAGDETPRLDLFAGNCVQCGICASSCPEQAITLKAHYLADPERRRRPMTLHEDPPFCCVQCGKPFATRRVIDNILDKLAGHAMFSSERARRRLKLCEDCRVVDAVQDAEAMQTGLTLPTDKTPDMSDKQ